MSDAPTPLEIYYASEYHRRNMQVARVCGAQASVDQALERALTVKSLPVWLIAYLESAANRLPGLQTDLAAWRDLAPDAPETVRAEAAEAALTREPYIVKIGPYHGICIGGRWDNWMFHMSANGQWVSQQKLSTASLTPPAEAAEAKLAKAVGALGDISNGEPEWPDDPQKELDWCRNRATTVIAELKGETNGTKQ